MTLVRPMFKYASSSWNRYTDIRHLEQIQKNEARFVCNDYNSSTSTSSLVKSLGWDALAVFVQPISAFYKFHNNLVNCRISSPVKVAEHSCGSL